jgi:hypothetical protein
MAGITQKIPITSEKLEKIKIQLARVDKQQTYKDFRL